jgi:hypothetical protein
VVNRTPSESRTAGFADGLRLIADALDGPNAQAGSHQLSVPPPPPKFRSGEEIVESADLGPNWIWYPYIAAGHRTLFVGSAKAGKSTLLYGLFGAMERGASFLGMPTTRTRAVVLTEESPITVREKVARFGVRETEFLLCDGLGVYSFEAAVGYAVDRAIEIGAEVVVVDTFAAWARLQGDGENDAGVILAKLEAVAKAAARGIAIVLVHHANKGGTSVDNSIRGSTALPGAVDIIVLLKGGGSGSGKRRTMETKSRFEGPSDALLYEYERQTGEFRVLGSRTQLALDGIGSRLLRALESAESTGFTEDELLNAAGVKRQSGKRALRALESANRVVVLGEGKRGSPKRYVAMPPPPPGEDDSEAA